MASPALTLRPATAEDYPDVAALYRQFARTRHLEQFTFKGWLGQCHLAVEDGQVIGYWHGTHDVQTWLSFTVNSTPPEDWTVSYLTVMVVDQRHRRRGIGWLLLKDFLVEDPQYVLRALPQDQRAGRA